MSERAVTLSSSHGVDAVAPLLRRRKRSSGVRAADFRILAPEQQSPDGNDSVGLKRHRRRFALLIARTSESVVPLTLSPARAGMSPLRAQGQSRFVQRDKANGGEPGARNALQGSSAGSGATCGCFWANASVPRRQPGERLCQHDRRRCGAAGRRRAIPPPAEGSARGLL